MGKLISVAKMKRCSGCDAIVNDDSYEVLKGTFSNADGIEHPHEAIMCKKCVDNIEWLKQIVMENVEPNENGDYEWGSITVRGTKNQDLI